jgi:penicillin-binding protein-related factor A (putative recombinase)
MAANYGKQFEQKFKEDFLKLNGSTIDRLYDTTFGYKSIKQVCDFIGYVMPNIFYLECKSVQGNTFPLSKLTQYDKLKEKVGIPGVRAGVIIWFYDHYKVVYVPISTITKLKNDNKKSINIKMLDENLYYLIDIPSKKLRIFLDSDYSVLLNLRDGD